VHVGDDETPALIVPLPVFAEATGRDGALVKYDVRAVTSKGEAADVRCDPPAGSQFIMGVTPVKCTAFGPNGKTISEIFNVTVADTTPPDLALPRDVREQALSPEGAKVTFSAYGKDAIDGETLAACFPASGDLFAPGTTTVHCASADASKNEATGTFEVTVIPWFDPVEPEN
jgi:large repetitive protein